MNITPQAFAEPDLVPEVSAAFRAGLAQRGIDLEAEVGRSAMSVVYRAADRRHGRAVALKVMQASSRTRYDADRFLREIQVAAGLQHPHILPSTAPEQSMGRSFTSCRTLKESRCAAD
jgi:hypothetical protein